MAFRARCNSRFGPKVCHHRLCSFIVYFIGCAHYNAKFVELASVRFAPFGASDR